MRYDVTLVETPVGTAVVATSDAGLHALEFSESEQPEHWRFARSMAGAALEPGARGDPTADRLSRYFDGDLAALDGLRVAAAGTPFQQRVWSELRRIPRGTVTSYGRLAASIGSPAASRAVGRANALNPVAIVVPCHRVVGSGGALVGYAGGLDRKRWLLRHEGVEPVDS